MHGFPIFNSFPFQIDILSPSSIKGQRSIKIIDMLWSSLVIIIVSRSMNTCLIWPFIHVYKYTSQESYAHFYKRGWGSSVRHHCTTTLICMFIRKTRQEPLDLRCIGINIALLQSHRRGDWSTKDFSIATCMQVVGKARTLIPGVRR